MRASSLETASTIRVNRDRQPLLATQIGDGLSGGGSDKVARVEIADTR